MNKQVLKLAIPSILANITIPLVGLVDTAIVGHISDVSAIGGIAVGTMLFDLLYWNFGFLRVGTSGLTAQAFGHRALDHETSERECGTLLTQSLTIAGLATLLIWAIQWLFVTAALACVPCSPEVAAFARKYFFIRIWAAPATLGLMALKGWFIGMQDTVSAMVSDIVVNVVNMAASYGLAVYTPLGAFGVAYGTIIAQFTGLLVAGIILVVKYRQTLSYINWDDITRWSDLRRLLVLNGNLFLRSLCFMVVYVGFTAIAGSYGDIQLAISSILMKLFMLFSYFVDGFAYAGEALVGKYIGAKSDRKTLNHVVNVLMMWSITVGLIFMLIYAFWGEESIRLMTDDVDVITASGAFMGWLIAMPLVSTLAFMWDGIFVGATAGKAIRDAMIWSAVGFVVSYAALYRPFGIQALYIAYFVHLVVRVIYLSACWRPTRNKYEF